MGAHYDWYFVAAVTLIENIFNAMILFLAGHVAYRKVDQWYYTNLMQAYNFSHKFQGFDMSQSHSVATKRKIFLFASSAIEIINFT
jgi:hypothetical protein